MYKVCFDKNDKIIGFNVKNCISYINLFNITNVNKCISEDKYVEELDSFGRRVFIKKHKKTGNTVLVSSMENRDFFEDELFEYTKKIKKIQEEKIIYLVNECDKFTIEDIINAKKEQLIEKYECSDCELFEIFDNVKGENYVGGKNFIRINENSQIELDKVKCKKNSNVIIYCENDKNINITLNKKMVNGNEFLKVTAENIKLGFNSDEEINIYSIAILFK